MANDRKQDRLRKDFFGQPTKEVASQLLGKTFARRLADGLILRGVVVEVEAYLSRRDAASHSFRGLGKKNASMFQAAGTLYVYPIHARHCLNVVTEEEGSGAAVLIRAIEPLQGHHRMAQLRFGAETESGPSASWKWTQLTQGPGRLCEALGVGRAEDGLSLIDSRQVWLEDESPVVLQQRWRRRKSVRIGISQAAQLRLRWFIDGNRFVSGPASDHSAGRCWSFQEEPS